MKNYFIGIIFFVLISFGTVYYFNKPEKIKTVLNKASLFGTIIKSDNGKYTVKPFYNESEYNKSFIIDDKKLKKEVGDNVLVDYDKNNSNILSYKLYKRVHEIIQLDFINEFDNKYIVEDFESYKKLGYDLKIEEDFFNTKKILYFYTKKDLKEAYSSDSTIYFNYGKESVDYNYYAIIIDKNIKIKEDKELKGLNTKEFYESFKESRELSIYAWRRNNKLYYGIVDSDQDLKEYIKAYPLNLDELGRVFKENYELKRFRIISNEKLTNEELNNIKKEIGVVEYE